MPGSGGSKKSKGKQAAGKARKGKSGNPAKRAQQQQAAAQRPQPVPGSAFGAGAAHGGFDPAELDDFDPASLDLPPGFEKFLGR